MSCCVAFDISLSRRWEEFCPWRHVLCHRVVGCVFFLFSLGSFQGLQPFALRCFFFFRFQFFSLFSHWLLFALRWLLMSRLLLLDPSLLAAMFPALLVDAPAAGTLASIVEMVAESIATLCLIAFSVVVVAQSLVASCCVSIQFIICVCFCLCVHG